ncbi:hypothetical protein Tco_0663291 [Tanacetum coccineum]
MSSSHSTVTYTFESDVDGSSWGIHLMPGYESDASEAAVHSSEYAPPADDDLEPVEAQALPTPADLEDDHKEEPSEEEEELPALSPSTPVIPDPASPSEEAEET